MKLRTMSIRGFLLIIGLYNVCIGQTPKVAWSSFNMGYAEPKSMNTMIKSVVGQNFVGTTQQSNIQIISGFLADTLFRSTVVDVKNQEQLPASYSLSQNYPNPFNPSTTIHFELPKESHVTLKVYNMLGQEVATLVNEKREVGRYNVEFRISNFEYSSGVYFYRLIAGDFVSTKKFVLLK